MGDRHQDRYHLLRRRIPSDLQQPRRLLMSLGFIQSCVTLTCSVIYNVDFITSAGRFPTPSNFLKSNLTSEDYTLEYPRLILSATILFSAFANAVNKYEDDSVTDDEGDMMNA